MLQIIGHVSRDQLFTVHRRPPTYCKKLHMANIPIFTIYRIYIRLVYRLRAGGAKRGSGGGGGAPPVSLYQKTKQKYVFLFIHDIQFLHYI